MVFWAYIFPSFGRSFHNCKEDHRPWVIAPFNIYMFLEPFRTFGNRLWFIIKSLIFPTSRPIDQWLEMRDTFQCMDWLKNLAINNLVPVDFQLGLWNAFSNLLHCHVNFQEAQFVSVALYSRINHSVLHLIICIPAHSFSLYHFICCCIAAVPVVENAIPGSDEFVEFHLHFI